MRNRKYIVDLNSKTYQVARYKQYDNNINYSIEVIEDGVLVDLDNCIVKAFFETPSKLILQKDCMVSDNTITTILDNNILGEAGKVLVEFTVYKDDIIVTTFTLSLDVEKSINKNDAIQKEPVWDIIANLLKIDETVRVKLEEVDNKIIETTEITNTNTSKIDNKILDIQNQLDSRISEKFTEIDNTLESKTTEKFIAVDEILNEKQTQIQEQVDNKISDADNKILDCEERMQNIESNFGDLVDGTGYATTEFVNKSLEKKSNIDHRHNVSEIDNLNMNAEDISLSDGSNVEENVYRNKENIQYIKNELSKTENTSYTTENGIKEFSCKDGYVDNVVIEGKTLVNLFSFDTTRTNFDDFIVRTYAKNDSRIINGTYTLYNFNDKVIHYTKSKLSDSTYLGSVDITPNSCTKVELGEDERIYGCDFWTQEGWEGVTSNYTDATMKLLVLEGDHTDKHISYFEGLKSVGQGDKIEVLSYKKQIESNLFNGSYRNGSYDSNGVFYADNNGTANANDINISGKKTLIIKNNSDLASAYCIYDSNTKLLVRQSFVGVATIDLPPNATYINFFIGTNNVGYNPSIQTEIYEVKYDKKQILTTLRSLPNGVKDTIEKRGNKYYKIKRCEETTYNGYEDWTLISSTATNTISCALTVTDPKGDGSGSSTISNVYCDKFKPSYPANRGNDEEMITLVNFTASKQIFIRVAKTKLSTQDLAGFKTWLASNPVTVVYELATPIIEELPNFNPQTFSDKTTLLLNSGVVQAEASFEVTNSLGSELEVLKGKVSDLDDNVVEIEKINLLNGWSNIVNEAYVIKNKNVVTLSMSIGGGITTNATTIGVISDKFRPKSFKDGYSQFGCVSCDSGYVYSPATIVVWDNGKINADVITSNKRLVINASWYV